MSTGLHQLPDIRDSATVETAARFMLFWDTDQVEVFDEARESAWIMTERDLVGWIAKGRSPSSPLQEMMESVPRSTAVPRGDGVQKIPPIREMVAGEAMSTPALACAQEASLDEVAELLADREIS